MLPIELTMAKPAVAVALAPYINPRTTRFFGIRVLAYPAVGTVADSYADAQITVYQNNSNPFAQPNADPVASTDTIPIPDDQVMKICSAGNPQFKGRAGDTYLLLLLEQDEDNLYPGGFAAAASSASGGGGNNPDNLVETQRIVAPSYTPTMTTDGAATVGAKGVQLQFSVRGGTFVEGGAIECWSLSSVAEGSNWLRQPDSDLVVPTGANGLTAFSVPSSALFASGVNVAFIPSTASVTGGVTQVSTVYRVQS